MTAETISVDKLEDFDTEVTMIPQTYVTLTDEADITNIGRILDTGIRTGVFGFVGEGQLAR